MPKSSLVRQSLLVICSLLLATQVNAESPNSSFNTTSETPNIIVILSDDQGYSDVGFNGSDEIPTPNLDALAASGVVFDAGYASHSYCSPSRAGLLTGRYQQRFGHECNPGSTPDNKGGGLPLDEVLMSNALQDAGYRTAAIGKWHLGDEKQFWPINRGFDEWFGFSGGGLSYWGAPGKRGPLSGVLRNGEPVPKSELSYLTDDFSDEAVKFIEQNHESPFFLYLAYNAPHSPNQVTREHLERVKHVEQPENAVYAAMVAAMDVGIGRVLEKLKELKIDDNTLVVFYSDNGARQSHGRNFPLRGFKGMLYEGGIRVPFCISWPGKIPAGKRFKHAVTALDIFPTAISVANVEPSERWELDGTDLMPYLLGDNQTPPHQCLFWRYAMTENQFCFAVRQGNMKLIERPYKNQQQLFDLDADPGEVRDLAGEQPEKVKELSALIQEWDAENMAPLWLDPHGKNLEKDEASRQAIFDKATKGQKKK